MSGASAFAGTGRLVRLALRRDRVKLAIWLLGVPLLAIGLAGSVLGVYATEQDRIAYAALGTSSVVARAFNGPVAGTSVGTVAFVESYITLAVLTALLSTFAVVRHTRQNEETGRAELLGAAVVGRYALLTAALIVTVTANLLAALLLGLALTGSGLPMVGSFAVAAAVATAGVSFAAVAAVTAQLAGSSRGANALASAAVGVAFLLRGVGDVLGTASADGLRLASAWPSWLSPLGWGQQMRPYEGERWWVLALPAALLVVGVAVAFLLTAHRDLGAGLLADRRGPAAAARRLLGPVGLAWRLQRGALIGWAVGVLTMSFAMGLAGDEIGDMLRQNEAAAEVIGQLGGGENLVDAYLAAMLALLALAIGAYAVQALLRLRGEEADGMLEGVLATAVSRPRWALSHILCGGLGTVALLLLGGLSIGLGYGLAAGEPASRTAQMAGAALAHAPAVLVIVGAVVLFFGLLPRSAVGLSWAVLITFLLLGQLGAVLDLPQQVLNVSPYTHVPAVPATDLAVTPLAWLAGVALALLAAGLVAFRRRDLAG